MAAEEQETRVGTMGDSTDSRTAADNEAGRVKAALWPVLDDDLMPPYDECGDVFLAERAAEVICGLRAEVEALSSEREAVFEAETILEAYGVKQGTRFSRGIVQAIAQALVDAGLPAAGRGNNAGEQATSPAPETQISQQEGE